MSRRIPDHYIENSQGNNLGPGSRFLQVCAGEFLITILRIVRENIQAPDFCWRLSHKGSDYRVFIPVGGSG
jgi:hypothetical protein